MYMKLNHPFRKLDITVPQSCGIMATDMEYISIHV